MSDKGLISVEHVKRLIQHLDNKSKEETIRATSAEEELRRMLGGKSIVYLSQAEYDDLSEEEKEDPTKIYFITDAENVEHVHSNKEFLDSLSQELLDTKADKSELFSGSYNDLTNKPEIPTKTSQLTNDSNFLTSIPSTYVTESEMNTYIDNKLSGLTMIRITRSEYDALATKDPNTLYLITN